MQRKEKESLKRSSEQEYENPQIIIDASTDEAKRKKVKIDYAITHI